MLLKPQEGFVFAGRGGVEMGGSFWLLVNKSSSRVRPRRLPEEPGPGSPPPLLTQPGFDLGALWVCQENLKKKKSERARKKNHIEPQKHMGRM